MWSTSLLSLVLALWFCCCHGQQLQAAGAVRCNYRQVQQMFDWDKFGPNGCIKLKSLAFIFGDGQEASPKLTAARFLTANLVFTGSVTHVTKDASVAQGTAYMITVQVHCYLKGRLSSTEIVVSGFQVDSSTGLCLSINCQDGDTGLFFTTRLSSGEIRINENGFVKEGRELDSAMRALRCRENYESVNFWPVAGQTAPYCRRIDASSEATCPMSIATAEVYLNHAFINFESHLKPECQEGKDFVMRQLLLPPLGPSLAYSKLSGDGNGVSRIVPSACAGVSALLLVAVRQLLTGHVSM